MDHPDQRYRIIDPEVFGPYIGGNVNGPSCIETPEWLPGRLGRYYLYFAHHRGDHIRFAVSDELSGPWRLREGGVLSLASLPQCADHIASPDVLVDEDAREIIMHFHSRSPLHRTQTTFFARSRDGLSFTAGSDPVAPYYLRVVRWRQQWIGMCKGGHLCLSAGLGKPFHMLRNAAFPMSGPRANAAGDVRHVALDVEGDRLWVFLSRIGDAPEHIRLGYVDLLRPPQQWRVEATVPLLRPVTNWEGAMLAPLPSAAGAATGPENALRDPAILRSRGRRWLFYSYAGETGIGLAALPDLASFYLAAAKTPVGAAAPPPAPPQLLHSAAGALSNQLAELDRDRPQRRIYLMGCGRSGTWLLTSLMASFADTEVIAKEVPVEAFGKVTSNSPTLVLKRDAWSYQRLAAIPPSVELLHIVRHPFDVLTSHNPNTGRRYHILPERWLGEMQVLRQLLAMNPPKSHVVTYEMLVRDPQDALAGIARRFGLTLREHQPAVLGEAELPPEAVAAMHGVRPVDQQSVGRYARDPEAVAYLRSIVPQLGETLAWCANTFGYDITLPDVPQSSAR